MKIQHVGLVTTLAAAVLAACASTPTGTGASADLLPRSGTQTNGWVRFEPAGDKILVTADISGLTPGAHGFHVHEAGDCSAPDAMSAKGHFNPEGKPHGHHGGSQKHAGDMPNLVADASGRASYKAELSGVKLSGDDGIIGRAVIVHADPDDYASQPAGNAGKRVACGVIKRS